jgi:TetR/AcrR family transcriptional repressor of nem operon
MYHYEHHIYLGEEAVMARTSRAEKARTHKRLVDAASRDFRTTGVEGTSIPRLMEEIGLTHGTFYAHFDSKDALVAESYATGMRESVDRQMKRAADAPSGQGLNAIIDRYLSAIHRDDPGDGCFLPSMAGEVRRQPEIVRHAFTDGLRNYFERLAEVLADGDADSRADHALVLASGMAGAVLLARAVTDVELSDRILDACRDFYTAAFASPVAESTGDDEDTTPIEDTGQW